MRSAVKKIPHIPTLAERIKALREEVEKELDRLAEEKRPASVPGPWMARGGGNLFEAYLIAVKDFPQ